MPQFIFTMKDLRKVTPQGKEILKGIWLSFYGDAKIGVLESYELGWPLNLVYGSTETASLVTALLKDEKFRLNRIRSGELFQLSKLKLLMKMEMS